MAAAESGRAVNIKKGQFVSPWDMRHAVEKCRAAGNDRVFVTERGSSFGYNNLVVDMRSLAIMRKFAPVVFDATHSVQLPGGAGERSGGERRYVQGFARAAVPRASILSATWGPNPDRITSSSSDMYCRTVPGSP